MPTALITGCSGQDGILLTRLLVEKGYRVFGVDREVPADRRAEVFAVDVADENGIAQTVATVRPDEIYHLAAYHHSSDARPSNAEVLATSLRVNTLSLGYLLEAMGSHTPHSRLFYAASSRIFGRASVSPQNERTPFAPVCEYGISKVAAIHLSRLYKASRSAFVSIGILFNHESPMRPSSFVTRKLSHAAARAKLGLDGKVTVNSASAKVDWGAAEDYVAAMHSILGLPEPGEFVVASGTVHTVGEFARLAFAHVGLDSRDFVKDVSEGLASGSGLPANAAICGDSSLLGARTGWRPTRSLAEIAAAMVDADIERLRRDVPVAPASQN